MAAIAFLLFGCLTIIMLGGGMAGFDGAVRMAVHALAAPWLTTCVEAVTLFGSFGAIMVFGGIVLATLLRAGRQGDAKFILFVVAGAVVVENVVKFAIQRPRPPAFFGTDPMTFSYPSGHAFFSLCFYGSLVIIMGRRGASRAVPWAVAVLVAAIGGTRIYLGVHYPSDVLAAYLLATAWLLAARAVFRTPTDLPDGALPRR